MKKTYTVKNYKGNLIESLENFSKKYPKSKIVESKVDGKNLKIITEDTEEDKITESRTIRFYPNDYVYLVIKMKGDSENKMFLPRQSLFIDAFNNEEDAYHLCNKLNDRSDLYADTRYIVVSGTDAAESSAYRRM